MQMYDYRNKLIKRETELGEIDMRLFLIPRIYIFPHPAWESQPLKLSV
jgi:hypothetical protein